MESFLKRHSHLSWTALHQRGEEAMHSKRSYLPIDLVCTRSAHQNLLQQKLHLSLAPLTTEEQFVLAMAYSLPPQVSFVHDHSGTLEIGILSLFLVTSSTSKKRRHAF